MSSSCQVDATCCHFKGLSSFSKFGSWPWRCVSVSVLVPTQVPSRKSIDFTKVFPTQPCGHRVARLTLLLSLQRPLLFSKIVSWPWRWVSVSVLVAPSTLLQEKLDFTRILANRALRSSNCCGRCQMTGVCIFFPSWSRGSRLSNP